MVKAGLRLLLGFAGAVLCACGSAGSEDRGADARLELARVALELRARELELELRERELELRVRESELRERELELRLDRREEDRRVVPAKYGPGDFPVRAPAPRWAPVVAPGAEPLDRRPPR